MSGIAAEGWFDIVSLNVSEMKGVRKGPVESCHLEEGKGIRGDAHSGVLEDRQVSFLAVEEIEAANAAMASGGGSCLKAVEGGLRPGDFAENVTTRGLPLHELPLGTRIAIGGTDAAPDVILEVSKIGKECHAACEIRRLVGDCVMPRRGIFARVVKGGEVRRGDRCHYRIG
jgi:MOSC domain-containing protein YiiM